ncbi:hypothetical protein [Pseudomonas sp. P1.31]|uniref:hypothetical protein n=1 Tax=Pseudomonas sp. P1.31 TaxID=1699311 RepID=UPI00069DD4A4|nr:hypothetical protein [Pseudomonas sp. P1.31]
MSTNQQAIEAADTVTKARADLDELLRIERLLETELPAARAALQAAEKKLRQATRPDKNAAREAELNLLRAKIANARQSEEHAHV